MKKTLYKKSFKRENVIELIIDQKNKDFKDFENFLYEKKKLLNDVLSISIDNVNLKTFIELHNMQIELLNIEKLIAEVKNLKERFKVIDIDCFKFPNVE